MYFFQHSGRILVTQHLHNTFHPIGLVKGIVIIAQGTFSLQIAVAYLSQITEKYGLSVMRADNDTAHLVQVMHKPYAAHHIAKFTAIKGFPARTAAKPSPPPATRRIR